MASKCGNTVCKKFLCKYNEEENETKGEKDRLETKRKENEYNDSLLNDNLTF